MIMWIGGVGVLGWVVRWWWLGAASPLRSPNFGSNEDIDQIFGIASGICMTKSCWDGPDEIARF